MNASFSLSKKLFIFIFGMVLLTILPLLYRAEKALHQFGNYANHENEKQFNQMACSYLTENAVSIAKTHNEMFKRIKTASAIMGSHLTSIYGNQALLSQKPLDNDIHQMRWRPVNHMFHGSQQAAVAVMYWGGQKISPDIRQEISAMTHFKPTLVKTKEIIPECLATHVITASGLGYYFTLNPDAKQQVYFLPSPSEFDLRDGEPVTAFTQSAAKSGHTRWTRIYKDDVIDGFMMTATTPVYGPEGHFKAVTGIDFPVDDIVKGLIDSSFLNDFTHSDNAFAFLLGNGGNIIAFPQDFEGLFGIEFGSKKLNNSDEICQMRLADSIDPDIRRIEQKLLSNHSGMFDINIRGEDYLLSIGCLKEVEWHMVLVAKRSDILVSIRKTAAALKETRRAVWNDFIIHSLLILLIASCLSYYASKLFIAPINAFIETTRKIARNDFSPNLEIEREDEIGALSRSLNSMAQQLKASELLKNEYAEKLETEVKLRTRELETANNELKQIRKGLEIKIDQKTIQLKRLNQYLMDSGESERKAIASDLHDSVAQTLALSIGNLKSLLESGGPMDIDRISLVKTQLEQAIHEIRLLIYELRPPVLDDFEIDVALGHLITGYENNKHCRIEYVNRTGDNIKTSPSVRLAAYRIINELIVNVLKHSKADEARVTLDAIDGHLNVEVKDNGVGFDWEKVKKTNLSAIGLFSISEQVRHLGGAFHIVSDQRSGTRIRFGLPMVSQ